MTQACHVPTHFERDHRQGKHEAEHEAALHILVFVRWPIAEGRGHWLKRHAADRTASWAGLLDLRMHRTGPDCAFWNETGQLGGIDYVPARIGSELSKTARAAKKVMGSSMGHDMLCGFRIDPHPADRIRRHLFCRGVRISILTMVTHCLGHNHVPWLVCCMLRHDLGPAAERFVANPASLTPGLVSQCSAIKTRS